MKALRKLALSYPGAEEGIACQGTALECSTFKARNKAFLFIGAADLKVKLGASLPEAAALAAKAPGRYKVGAHGWVTVAYDDDASVALEVLERWLDESYCLVAPKQLVALLAGGAPAADSKKTKGTKKKSSHKKQR